MKHLILIFALAGSSAFAENSELKPVALGAACEAKITKAVVAQCNKDSKKDPSREHACVLDTTTVKRNQSDAAYFEMLLTVTDADDYTYGISVENKTKCQFKVVSLNN